MTILFSIFAIKYVYLDRIMNTSIFYIDTWGTVCKSTNCTNIGAAGQVTGNLGLQGMITADTGILFIMVSAIMLLLSLTLITPGFYNLSKEK